MILLNITHIIAHERAPQYLDWLQREYIPLLKEGNTFVDIKLFKILDSPNEGQSLSLQLIATNQEAIQTFKTSLFTILEHKMQQDLKGYLFIFDTSMQAIEL